MARSKKPQSDQAKEYLKQGKGPLSVSILTGLSLSRVYAIQKQLRESGELTTPESKMKSIKSHETSNQVKITLMNEMDIQNYGLPAKVDLMNIEKEFYLEIGPLGISMADKVVAETLEPLKQLGIKDIHITIKAGGNHV